MYKVLFADGAVDWFKQEDVTWEASAWPPAPKPSLSLPRKSGAESDSKSLEAFLRKNKYFAVPWMILAAALIAMSYVPIFAAHFSAHGMQPMGLASAAKLTVWAILCSFAVHGWIAVNHDELVNKSLKVVKTMPYDFRCGDASIRSSLIFFFGMMVYAFVPMRMAPAATWGQAILQFIVGYLILLIGGDAWFFCVHYTAHTPTFYALLHKTHHKWKYPTSFSAYYITSGTHAIQEHMFTIPALLLLPVPWSAFMFYQYYGVPAAQIQHCGFNLDDLHVPFCGHLKLGHLMSICGLGLGYVLGSQTIAAHDYHHETFMGNFQLSYSYLDKLFGLYVDPTKRSDTQESLLAA